MMPSHVYAFLASAVIVLGQACTPYDERQPEQVLRAQLQTMREVLGQYREERTCYPTGLAELVAAGYLREVPIDPMTGTNADWIEVLQDVEGQDRACKRGINNVKSGSTGVGSDGTRYDSW